MRPILAQRLLAGLAAPAIVLSCAPKEAAKPPMPDWMANRERQEAALAEESQIVHNFRFTDRRDSSGITFASHIVDDAGRTYKAVHYDHGMGVCAADVDGDGLTDLFFPTQLGTNELWKNTGGGHFTNITKASGIDMVDQVAVGCSFADIDNDGLPDLFVTTVRHGNRLFHNLGGGKFQDITAEAGVGYVGHSSGAVFFDYDGDGLLDLFVANVGVYTTNVKGNGGYYVGLEDAFQGHMHPDRAEASILYHNEGHGRFKDVTRETGLVDKSWSGDATVIDVNEDGRPDLYVLNMQGQNHLWLNEGGKHFRDATDAWFPRTPWGAMGVKAFDFNNDGKVDLYLTDMHSDMMSEIAPENWAAEMAKSDGSMMPPQFFPHGRDKSIFGNALFAAHPAGAKAAGYDEVSDAMGVETYWPWGPSVDDINADGWDDIFVVNSMNFPYRYAPNSVLLNEHGKHFMPAEFTLGVEPRANNETEQMWFAPECGAGGADAGSKSCVACAQPNAAQLGCRHGENGRLEVWASKGTRSVVIFDLDNDGDLDIVTNEFNAPPQVLVSNLSASPGLHFLKVHLQGTKSNRQGIGARVTVILPDSSRHLKVMDGKSGYLSQSDLPLYFGLASADHAAAIEVRWPSGKTQRMDGPIAANKVVNIVEP